MTKTPSKTQILLARLVVVLMVALIVLGLAWNGFSHEDRVRLWQNIIDRPGGPMTFRFILQPAMATLAALFDGIKDARTGRSPHDSPHSQMAPNICANRGWAASIWVNRLMSGSRRKSVMFGMSS
jgi:hypothetical protein